MFLITSPTFSQIDRIVKGKVIDGQTLSPLSYANIAFMDSEIGTSGNENGDFELKNSINASTLVISYVGYKSLIIDVSDSLYNKIMLFKLLPINIFLQEVTVYSKPYDQLSLTEISNLSIQSEKIKDVSPGMPDILRSVQSLPGISVNNEFKADYNVRGGNQDENLVLVNGAKVYEPFHIKEAANASVGIFNVDLIKRVDLITGGFSAKYGDKMSSVLNIKYREGSKEKFSGAVSASLAYLDGYFEGPLSNDVSIILGVRKSYLEYVLSMVNLDEVSSLKPSFYDVQGVINYNISTSSKLLLEFIHAGDDFAYSPFKKRSSSYSGTYRGQAAQINTAYNENEEFDASYFSNLFDIQSINILSSKAILKGEISYYEQTDNEYRLFRSNDDASYTLTQNGVLYYDKRFLERITYDTLRISTFELRSDLSYQFNPSYEAEGGISFQNIGYKEFTGDIFTRIRKRNVFNNPTSEVIDTSIYDGEFGNEFPIDASSYKINAYIENIFQLNQELTFNIGGRIDYFDLNKDFTFSPRLSAGYLIAPSTTLRAAWGYYYQSPIYRQLRSSAASDTNTSSQLAIHYIIGLDHSFYFSHGSNDYLQIKAEAYYKDYRDLISSRFGVFERITYSGYNDAVGNAKGLDIYAVLNLSDFYCWVSYGLLFANEDKLNDDIGMYPRYTDQRHTLALISSVDLGANWQFSLKGFYGSGFPYTPRSAINNNGTWEWKQERVHSAHLPAYKRVDVRIEKEIEFSGSSLNIFVDVSNVFNFKNIQNYEYKTPGISKPEPEEVLLWPIFPSFGVRYNF